MDQYTYEKLVDKEIQKDNVIFNVKGYRVLDTTFDLVLGCAFTNNSTKDSGIMINMDKLIKMGFEHNEIIAIIGHEVGHLELHHNEEVDTSRTLTKEIEADDYSAKYMGRKIVSNMLSKLYMKTNCKEVWARLQHQLINL
jgi:Zn-dependent protease with chaperone function